MFLAAILVASIVSLPVAVPALSDSGGILTGETWAQEAKLEPADLEPEEWAGYDVDLDGSTAVVGAPSNWDADGPGRVFVFEDGPEGWTLVAALEGGDVADLFGKSVAIDGDRIVVGAPHGDTPDAGFAGGVHVYERAEDGTWPRTAVFAGEDSDVGDEFGAEVALDGDTLVVGAKGDTPNGLKHEGSAYVFELGAEGWQQTAKLVPDDPEEDAKFGFDIGVEGDTILAGVLRYDEQANAGGTAFVFEDVPGSGWTQTDQLWPSEPGAFHRFGYSVTLHGDEAAIGAPGDSGSGAVYVFERAPSGAWTQETRFEGDGDPGDSFGKSLDLENDRLVVGASAADEIDEPTETSPISVNDGFQGAGAAFVFEEAEANWQQVKKVVADDRGSIGPVSVDDGTDIGDWDWDGFGRAVALDGDRFLVGAFQDDTDAGDQTGSAYVFDEGCPGQPTPIPASPPAPGCLPPGGTP